MDKVVLHLIVILCLNQVRNMSPVVSSESEENANLYSDDMDLQVDDENISLLNASESDIKLIEEIKIRILRTLHRTEPPETHAPVPPLQHLNFEDEEEDEILLSQSHINTRSKTRTQFLPADIDGSSYTDQNGNPCLRFHFELPQAVQYKEFKSIELWMYKKQSIKELHISKITTLSNVTTERLNTTVYNQTFSNSWVRFNVSHLVDDNATTLYLEVSANYDEVCLETDEDKKPFLLIQTKETRISKRSAVDCTDENTHCCKKNLFLSFKDINWHNWIIHPEGYDANFCNGSCRGSMDLASTHHTQVIMALCEKNPEKAQEMGITNCGTCVPVTYRSISVIYLDEQGVQVVSHLPGMSASECGCA